MKLTKLTYVAILAFVLLLPASAFATTQSSSFDTTTVFVVDGTGTSVKDLNLKAVQDSDGNERVISSFVIEPEDVVQVRQDNSFMVFTGSSEDIIEKVKVISSLGITTELVNIGGNSYTTQGLATGVYTLHIIVDTGNEKELFETLLVVLGPNQSPINPLTIINTFETKTIIKFNGNGNGNNTKDNKTKINNTIDPVPIIPGPKDNGTDSEDPEPICDNVPFVEGQSCRDEGDFTDCPPGQRDFGFGCEVVEEETDSTDADDDSTSNEEDDTGGENPNGEEEDQNCGGEPCTDNDKEDSWLDDEGNDDGDGEEEVADDEESSGETTEGEEA